MSSPGTIETFFDVLSRSELLNDRQLDAVHSWLENDPSSRSWRREAASREAEPTGHASPLARRICDWLCRQQWITAWQAEKLLQGKHRGFQLGPYVLQEKIARGGMSTIYAGRHRESGLLHALKVLPLSRTHKASYLPRFKREAELAVRLVHPHIVRVYQIHHEHDGRNDVYFMAMELMPGRDLHDLVNSHGPLPCRQAARYIRQAALGLQFAHDAGLVHRDVKPGNLFLHDDGNVRLLDLGLANDFENDDGLTREFNERVLGTADYLSPEQAIDSHLADARSDVYSLGCTLYFLLTGRPPFQAGTLAERILAHQSRTPEAVSEFRDDVPAQLTELLDAMLKKDRDRRISSAAAVAERLESWLTSVAHDPRYDVVPALHRPINPRNARDRSADAMELGKPLSPSLDAAIPIPPSSTSKSRRQGDAPTDALRSCRPLTTPPGSRLTPVPESPYLPEFQQFLAFLDQQMGVNTVLTPRAQQAHLRTIAQTLPEPAGPVWSPPSETAGTENSGPSTAIGSSQMPLPASAGDNPDDETPGPLRVIPRAAQAEHTEATGRRTTGPSSSAIPDGKTVTPGRSPALPPRSAQISTVPVPTDDDFVPDDLRAQALIEVNHELSENKAQRTTSGSRRSQSAEAYKPQGRRLAWFLCGFLLAILLTGLICGWLFPAIPDALIRWVSSGISR